MKQLSSLKKALGLFCLAFVLALVSINTFSQTSGYTNTINTPTVNYRYKYHFNGIRCCANGYERYCGSLGGGGGGGGSISAVAYSGDGGGGGGGGYTTGTLTAGTYSYSVGAGGTAGQLSNSYTGQPGGSTTIGTFTAGGGGGGPSGENGNGGTGTAGTGTDAGGTGAGGSGGGLLAGTTGKGGAGGGAAGSLALDTMEAAQQEARQDLVLVAGPGRTHENGNGNTGTSWGGGGSGSFSKDGAVELQDGGNGANGQLILIYTMPSPTVSISATSYCIGALPATPSAL